MADPVIGDKVRYVVVVGVEETPEGEVQVLGDRTATVVDIEPPGGEFPELYLLVGQRGGWIPRGPVSHDADGTVAGTWHWPPAV